MLYNKDEEEEKKRKEAISIINQINSNSMVGNTNNTSSLNSLDYEQRKREAESLINSINPTKEKSKLSDLEEEKDKTLEKTTSKNTTDNNKIEEVKSPVLEPDYTRLEDDNSNNKEIITNSNVETTNITKPEQTAVVETNTERTNKINNTNNIINSANNGGISLAKNTQEVESNNNKWEFFTAGEFEDGYQFGDVTKTIAATALDLFNDFSTGGLQVVENVVDIGANIYATLQNIFGNKEGAQATREWANTNYSEKLSNYGTNTSVVGALYNISKGTSELNPFENTTFEEGSVSGETTDQVVNLVGYTAGMWAGGKLLNAIGVGADVSVNIGSHVLNLPKLAITGGMSSGLAEANAKGENVSELERWGKAITGGLTEGASEGLFGTLGIGGNDITETWIKNATSRLSSGASKTLVKLGIEATGEATEEFISYAGNYLADNLLIDKLGDTDFSTEWNWEDVGEQMALAFLSTAVSSGSINSISTNAAISSAEKQLGRELTQQEKGQLIQTLIDNATVEEEEREEAEREAIDFYEEAGRTDVGDFYVTTMDRSGKVTDVTKVLGKSIISSNSKLNVSPVIVKNVQDNVYNVIDADTGVLLDGTPYPSIVTAQLNFSQKAINLDDVSVREINKKISEADISLKAAIGETVKAAAPYVPQNVLSSNLNNETVNYASDTSNSLYGQNNDTSVDITNNDSAIYTPDNTSSSIENIEALTEAYNTKQTYTQKQAVDIWDNIVDTNENAGVVYDNDGNIQSYAELEYNETTNRLVANQYDGNDDIVNSIEIIPNSNGTYNSTDITKAIREVTANYDENAPIQGQVDIEGNQVRNINTEQEQSTLKSDIENFSNQVDAVLNGTFPKNSMLTLLSHTPKPLQDIGLQDLPITMTQRHLITIMKSTGDDKNANYHDLGIDTVKQLPEAISNPLDIIESNTKADSIVLTTYLEDKQGNTVIASIRINRKGTINNIRIDTNIMTSAYGKNNYDKFMENNLKNGKLLYDIDKGVIKKVTGARFQLPGSSNSTTNSTGSSINNSVPQKTTSVNTTNKSMQNTQNNTNKKQKTKTNSNTKNKSSNNTTKIEDFGEKIGGARKDTSTKRGAIKNTKEVIHDYTVQNNDNGYTVEFKGKILKDGFKTQEEAEQYILDFKENVKSNLAFVREYSNQENNRYLIYIRNPRTLKSSFSGKEFSNKQDAESYAIALSMYLKEHGKNLFRPTIQETERNNPNSRNASKAKGDDIINNFGFKGGEFGNWVTQNERQLFLNYAQDAFTDLAVALDVDPKSLGQNNEMSIAFGARGKGLTGAVAHFEPSKKVINMTRLKGAGSLAHEYGHSIDNYLSRIGGYSEDGMATTNIRNPKLSKNMENAVTSVIDAMNYSTSTNQDEINKKNAIYENRRKQNLDYFMKDIDRIFRGEATTYKYNRKTKNYEHVSIKVTEEQKQEYQKIRDTLTKGKIEGRIEQKISSNTLIYENIYPEPVNTLQKMYKEVVGRKLNDDTVYGIYRNGKAARQVTEVKSESAYKKSAIEIDRAMGRASKYASTTEEMWARAFEAYVYDKLKAKGITNTYLVHSVNNNDYALFNPFPAGEERKNINKAFDNLIKTMKNEGFFIRNNTTPTTNEDIRYMKKSNSKNNVDTSNTNDVKTVYKNTSSQDMQKELHNRIQEALSNKNSKGKTYIGTVSEKLANKIQQLFGIKVSDRRHVLADYDIRHMINQHGNPIIENQKGQIAITLDDIEKIPDIISNYDRVVQGNDNVQGKTIRYIKKYSDNISYVVEVVPEKGSALKIKTMWKKPVRVTNSKNTPSLTSETQPNLGVSTSNNSIARNEQNVKTNETTTSNTEVELPEVPRNAERETAYIEQELRKIEKSGNWDNSIPVTRMTDIKNMIENYLGIGIEKGHFRQLAYALYKSKRDIIRTKELKDMDSILHEVGHALDLGSRIKVDKEAISNELLKAVKEYGGYETDSRAVQLDEGFAEVMREYSIIPEQAKTDYPQSVAVIEAIRQNVKSFNEFMTKLQQQTYNYIHQNPRNRVLSNQSIGEQTDKAVITKDTIKREVMRNVYDRDYVVKEVVNSLAKTQGRNANSIKASENAYLLTRLASGIGDKVTSMLSNGYIDESGKKLMPGLNKLGDILNNDPNRFNDLRAYLVAQRDLEYKAKTLKTGIRTMDSKAVVERFKNDTQIQRAAKIVYDTVDGVLQYAVDHGLITEENAKSLRESNTFYVPMQRVIENRGNQVGRRGTVADVIKARTGSELDIKDVLENIVANSSNIIQQVENNDILKALYKQGEASGLTGSVYDVIPAPVQKVGTAQLSLWEKELQKQGVNTFDLDMEKTIDLFVPNNKVDTKNLITSFIGDDGKRVYLQFSDELLFNSLMGLDKKFASQILNISSKLNMPLRYGATMANVGFAIPNMISDTAQAAIFSTAGFVPVVDNAIGVLDILVANNRSVRNFVNKLAPQYAERINRLYTLYQQSGATSATRLSQYRKSTQEVMRDIYGTRNSEVLGIDEKFKPLKRLLDIMTYIPELSEQSTRFRVFERNYSYYLGKGNSETDARIMAAIESRDATQDFGRTGTITREINQLIPFSAARVGSVYTFAEKIKANPKKVATRIAVLTAIAMAIKGMGYDDKEIEELNQRKKDDNFVLKIGDTVVTIKKPQGILRSIINLAEYIQDLATGHIEKGKEAERLGEWLNNAIMDNMPADSLPSLVPNAVAPLIENAVNKDFYYNSDIVKSYDLDLPNSEQYYDYNSQLAIWLGQIFNYSPAKIDNLISGYFGGLGTSVTNVIDWLSGKLGIRAEEPNMGAEDSAIGKRFVVNVNKNSQSVDDVYTLKDELTKKQNGGTITEEEEKQLEALTSATSKMAAVNKQIRAIKQDFDLDGDEKAEQIRALQEQKTDVARQALGKELIYAEDEEAIESLTFYPSRSSLSLNGYSLELSEDMKKEYMQIAYEQYKKYESQGLYSEEYLETLESKCKDYAKKYLMQKYKNELTK